MPVRRARRVSGPTGARRQATVVSVTRSQFLYMSRTRGSRKAAAVVELQGLSQTVEYLRAWRELVRPQDVGGSFRRQDAARNESAR
jgi:hypothetical protein